MKPYIAEKRTSRPDTEKFSKGITLVQPKLTELGYNSFKNKGQQEIINTILIGRDTIGVLPTGGGKTLTAILPAVIFDWKVLIFSPLKALMQDMVNNLSELGLSAVAVSSAQTQPENMFCLNQWRCGEIQFLLVAPERINNKSFEEAMKVMAPDMVVIDEAHVGSEWSNSFRPEYAQLGKVIDTYKPKQVLALTATAPGAVIFDIRRLYGLADATLVKHMPIRENLKLSSINLIGKGRYVDTFSHVRDALKKYGTPAIIYAATRNKVENLQKNLSYVYPSAMSYHGGMSDGARESVLNNFMRGDCSVVCATNAFGMGLDKANVRTVIHADRPANLEALAQEIGRAGRDDKKSHCLLVDNDDGYNIQRFLFDMSYPSYHLVKSTYDYICKLCSVNGGAISDSVSDIASMMGKDVIFVGAAVNVLIARGSIIREKPKRKEYVFTAVDTENGSYGQEFDDLVKSMVPIKGSNGAMSVEAVTVHETFSEARVNVVFEKLTALSNAGAFNFQTPIRSKITRISDDPETLPEEWKEDWKRISSSFKENMYIIDQYVSCPDSDKPSYLKRYFEQV